MTAAALLAVAALLLLGAVVVVGTQRAGLATERDDRLKAQAEEIAARLASGADPQELVSGSDSSTQVQIVSADGAIVVQAGTTVTAWGDSTLDSADGATSGVFVTDLTAGDEDLRVASTTVSTPSGNAVVRVASPRDEIVAGTVALVRLLVFLVPIGALAVAGLTWVLVGRTLRPVAAIGEQADAIGSGDLHRRVPEPGTDDEIDHLAHTVNAMLGRLEEGAAREARFTSDASHELRTPLTRMRVALEVDAAHPEAADEAVTRDGLLAEIRTMQSLVADLLQLSRSEAAAEARPATEVDLDDLVLAEAEAQRRAGSERRIDLSAVGAARVRGDGAALARVVRNLLENAERHATSTVVVTLVEDGDDVVLAVTDDGAGIEPADRERVFDRFVRLDEARTASAGGSGLGLAIVRSIVEAHGGRVTVEGPVAPASGVTFRVRLPSAEA